MAVDIVNGPVFYEGILEVTQPSDTFMSFRGWSKGVAFVNGFNLGRFWPVRITRVSTFLIQQ
jgi:beta-galactosidase